jgi:hypothetical protein
MHLDLRCRTCVCWYCCCQEESIGPRQIVEFGYDPMAEQYLASKDLHDRAPLDALETVPPRLRPGCPRLTSA